MELHNLIQIGSFYFFIFAVFNITIPWILHWKDKYNNKLKNYSKIYFYIGYIILIFISLLFSIISFFYAEQLISTTLGRFILISMASFWILIALLQIFLIGLKSIISILSFFHLLICILIYITPIFFLTQLY